MRFALKIKNIYISPITVVTSLFLIYSTGSIYPLLIYFFAGIHELGHLFCMKLCKIKAERIEIYPLSVSITPKKSKLISYRDEAVISSGGPIFNLFSAFILLLIGRFYPFHALPFCVFANIWLFFINILPISLLDGGRIFKSLVMPRMEYIKGYWLCNAVSYIFIAFVTVLGGYIFYITQFNASLLFMGIYLAICARFKERFN